MGLKIAVISDLHCSDRSEPNKTTYLYSDLLKKPVSHHPIEAIKKKISDDGLKCDYLICLGDITNKINQQGLISGVSYLQEIAVALSISPEKTILIAGNHDVDSRKIHKDYNEFNYIIINNCSVPVSDEDLCNRFWTKKYILKEYNDFIILAYNSVYNHTDESRASKTDIDSTTLEQINEDLFSIKNSTKPKIAICHHHPRKISNNGLKYRDGDSIENGDTFIQLLAKYQFDLFIHGHKHIPNLEYQNQIPIFCSGSFSSLENIAEFGKRNTFHIIEMIPQLNSKHSGIIETYEFTLGKGWKKNTDSEGFFPSDTGFGYSNDIHNLANQINDWFNCQNKDLIEYNAVIELFGDLKFLTPSQQCDMQEILLSKGIKIIPSLSVVPSFITKAIVK